MYGRMNDFCMNVQYGVLIFVVYTYQILQTRFKAAYLIHGDCKYIFPAHIDIYMYPKVQVIGVWFLILLNKLRR